jgi:hypothetical protein
MKIKVPLLFILPGLFILGCSSVKEGLYEENAINALDKLTETIGKLESCSYVLATQLENEDGITVKVNDVYMRAPDKMHIYTQSNEFRRGYWYNGRSLSIFDFDENVFDSIPAPGSIMLTIDSIHATYDMDFPAADFFYPTLTDDLMNDFDTIVFIGTRTIDDVACKEINASNASMDVYILIEESTNLPKGLEIYGLNERKGRNYFATFSQWKLDPKLPDQLFQFTPPSGSTKGVLITKKIN